MPKPFSGDFNSYTYVATSPVNLSFFIDYINC